MKSNQMKSLALLLFHSSVTALQEINPSLFQQGADPGNFFTVFLPNDSYTYPIPPEAQRSFYTNWTLINDVSSDVVPSSMT